MVPQIVESQMEEKTENEVEARCIVVLYRASSAEVWSN